MKHIIHIFGASGSGTTTLGRKLCDRAGFTLLDADNYFWVPSDPPFTEKRKASERVELLKRDIANSNNVVLSGSIIKWGDELIPLFTLAIRLETDTPTRIQRIIDRQKNEYGNRIERGGDMYYNHIKFVNWAREYDKGGLDMRSKASHDQWQRLLECKVITLKGADDLEENCRMVTDYLSATENR